MQNFTSFPLRGYSEKTSEIFFKQLAAHLIFTIYNFLVNISFVHKFVEQCFSEHYQARCLTISSGRLSYQHEYICSELANCST